MCSLEERIIACRRCPRLVEFREAVARRKKKEFREEEYWGKAVPGFGDPQAKIWILGLAPGAHGANRTGRVFTGDSSGLWLYRALHQVGLANQALATGKSDGLRLPHTYVTCAVRCAPPDNKPTPEERDTCAAFLQEEWKQMEASVSVVVALGAFAFAAAKKLLQVRGETFAHGREIPLGSRTLLCSYHPSRQNTQTGVLTESMLREVLGRAAELGRR